MTRPQLVNPPFLHIRQLDLFSLNLDHFQVWLFLRSAQFFWFALLHFLFAMPFPGENEQFAKCAHNNCWFGTGCATTSARQVMHANLRIGIASACKLIEDLSVYHSPTSLQSMLAEKWGRIELECTIHIARI